jgi:hypothetical protein
MVEGIGPFLKALFRHFWTYMSCAVFTIAGIYAAASNKPNQWIVGCAFSLAGLGILISAFLAWKDEYSGRAAALTQLSAALGAAIQVQVSARIDLSAKTYTPTLVFELYNAGKNPAYSVRIGETVIKASKIVFGVLPVLNSGERKEIVAETPGLGAMRQFDAPGLLVSSLSIDDWQPNALSSIPICVRANNDLGSVEYVSDCELEYDPAGLAFFLTPYSSIVSTLPDDPTLRRQLEQRVLHVANPRFSHHTMSAASSS